MTLSGKWYRGGLAKIHNRHISVLYIFCEVKFEFSGISMLFPVHWLSMDKPKLVNRSDDICHVTFEYSHLVMSSLSN